MNKNIIIVGAIAAGLYMLSQGKKTTKVVAKKKAPRRPPRLYPKPHPYLKPKDQQGYSKKKTTEDVLKDLGLRALPRSDVEHVQEPEEEPKKQEKTSKKKTTEHIVKDYVEQQKKQKLKDQGYSKKKTQEEIYKDLGLWALP